MMHEYDYLMFLDDDFMPREGLVAALLNQAATCGDRFSAIGRSGRFFSNKTGSWQYVRANLPSYRAIHMTGGGEFIVAARLPAAVKMRNDMAAAGATGRLLWHDDLILDLGIQREFGCPPYMADGEWAECEMDACGYAFSSKRGPFRAERNAVINCCYECGWRPVPWVPWKRGKA